jgi:hypothetical protein
MEDESMSDTFGFTTKVLEKGRILAIDLHGATDLKASLSSLRTLATTLAGTSVEGLVMDYSRHHVTYDIDGFSEIAKAYCTRFPEGFPVAFVYKPDQVARVIFMTRRLEESGRPSRAFSANELALEWLQEKLAAAGTATDAVIEAPAMKRRAAG